MGDTRTGHAPKGGCVRAAGAFCVAALAASAFAAPPAPREPAAQGLAGATVRFEEAPSSNILYLQEKGGMVTQVDAPAREGEGLAKPAAAPSKAPAKADTPEARRLLPRGPAPAKP